MLKNNKGFTIIELIMSFLFSSILALSLFAVIVSYRNKQTDSAIESELIAFKSQLIMDIQKDIQLKGLSEMKYCDKFDEHGNKIDNAIEPTCVDIIFNEKDSSNNNIIKTLNLTTTTKEDIIENKDGTSTSFTYTVPYITYGDIRYEIPDGASVEVLSEDYFLQSTNLYDGTDIDYGTTLYKIGFNLRHADLDTDIDFAIVANGTKKVAATGGEYQKYNVGQEVYIQVDNTNQRKFRVLQYSNEYKSDLLLLYDDVEIKTTNFNTLGNMSNRYSGSIIRQEIEAIERQWYNVDSVRLITIEEIAKFSSFCPQYRGVDSADASLATAPDWIKNWAGNKSYWTGSEKLLSNDNNGKKVWYVNGASGVLTDAFVNENYEIRPVVVAKKTLVTNL